MNGSLRFTWAWTEIELDDFYRQNISIVRVDLVYAYHIKLQICIFILDEN